MGAALHGSATWSRSCAEYRAKRELLVRLAAAEPANKEHEHDLVQADTQIGDLLAPADLAGAQTAYRTALALGERLLRGSADSAVAKEITELRRKLARPR